MGWLQPLQPAGLLVSGCWPQAAQVDELPGGALRRNGRSCCLIKPCWSLDLAVRFLIALDAQLLAAFLPPAAGAPGSGAQQPRLAAA